MRRSTPVLLLTTFALAASACSDARSAAPAAEARTTTAAAEVKAPAGPLRTIALRVPDMACGLCTKPIEANLREMGVRGAKADLASKWVTGRFDPKQLTPEQIRARIKALKFRVTEVRVG